MLMKPQWPSDAFEQWWQHYPRKVAKKYARRVFARLRRSGEVPFEVMLSATQNYARAMVGQEMKYVAHPATWLNGGRWDDVPEALINGRVQASPLPVDSGFVLIKRGSPAWLAWEKQRGWSPAGDWYSNSEWPK